MGHAPLCRRGTYQVETMPRPMTRPMLMASWSRLQQAQARIRELHVQRSRIAQGLPAEDGPYTVRRGVDEYLAGSIAIGNRPRMPAGGPKR